MSSSSSSSHRIRHRVNNQLCSYNLPIRILTSWTLDKPLRRFLVCLNRNHLDEFWRKQTILQLYTKVDIKCAYSAWRRRHKSFVTASRGPRDDVRSVSDGVRHLDEFWRKQTILQLYTKVDIKCAYSAWRRRHKSFVTASRGPRDDVRSVSDGVRVANSEKAQRRFVG
nr:hypothetical protein [Tanacetum cinerariifolium]